MKIFRGDRMRIIYKILKIILVISVILSLIYSATTNQAILESIDGKVDNRVQQTVAEQMNDILSKIKGEPGKTPVAGKDFPIPKNGKDAVQPRNGKDSFSTHTKETIIEKQTIESPGKQGIPGNDGKTPMIRCNTEANRWEIKYGINEVWRMMNDEPVPCLGVANGN